MLSDLKHSASTYYRNLKGWRTSRKIIVFESDDWGSIRMPSRQVYEKCLAAGYPVHLNPYEKYDSLASKDDLEMLFSLLLSFKDKNQNPPIITANCVVTNPDFEKIRKDNFQNYHFELITDTFKSYPNHSTNFDIWQKASLENVFFPQFHAREHLNVSKFMRELNAKEQDAIFGFDNLMPGCLHKGISRNKNSYIEATNYEQEEDKIVVLDAYVNGLDIFEKLFGFKSLSITPTNYTWHPDFDQYVYEKGVKYIQGVRKMRVPSPNMKPYHYERYLGKRNDNKQIDLVRNVYFEPSLSNGSNHVEKCLKEITIAFNMNKPGIICSHRLNFVGFIDTRNRDHNLIALNELLKKIVSKWPDVEFMTSNQLGSLIY